MFIKSMTSVFALLIPSLSFAGWDDIGKSNDSIAYVDVTSIRKIGNIARIEVLLDFYTPRNVSGGKPYLSWKEVNDYDCQKQLVSTAQISAFGSRMAKGEVIFSSNYPQKWKSISSDGYEILSYKIACGLLVKK